MIHLKMLLQDNGAARKVHTGKNFNLCQDLFHESWLGFRLHDMEEDDEEEGEQEEDVQGTHKDGKIFHFSFCFFYSIMSRDT